MRAEKRVPGDLLGDELERKSQNGPQSESIPNCVSPLSSPFLGEPGYREDQLTLAQLRTVKRNNDVVLSSPEGTKSG